MPSRSTGSGQALSAVEGAIINNIVIPGTFFLVYSATAVYNTTSVDFPMFETDVKVLRRARLMRDTDGDKEFKVVVCSGSGLELLPGAIFIEQILCCRIA
ncbi:hypothetical protein ACFL5Z_21275, partial [Planctomycetota bacterium]